MQVNALNISGLETCIARLTASSDLLNSEIKDKKDKQQELRNEWVGVNKRTFSFDENQSICPCCGRPYDMGK